MTVSSISGECGSSNLENQLPVLAVRHEPHHEVASEVSNRGVRVLLSELADHASRMPRDRRSDTDTFECLVTCAHDQGPCIGFRRQEPLYVTGGEISPTINQRRQTSSKRV